MAVITISRKMGSLGTEIAQEAAGKLKYEYLDREGIERGLTAHGLAVPEVDKFDEKSPPFWVNWQNQGRKFFRAMQIVIYRAARKGNVVIVGRGGQVLLRGIPGVFHVRINAPLQDRVQRLITKDGGNEKELLRILKQSDRDSGGFIRAFLDADWENEDLYDLTINTRHLTVDLAVDMISLTIPVVEAMKDIQRSRELLDDLILQKKIEIVLLNANFKNVLVEVAGGVATLRGNVSSSVEASNYVNLVSGVEGVQKVNSYMAIYTHIGT
ncbi:MAG: cytidylate kinase family protein [Deltaproteobacteria bacterium]|nr:cytidylate kinase family protein [Deltaproteobacteria bacterium]